MARRLPCLASYTGYGGGNENDWFKWVGLNVLLGPTPAMPTLLAGIAQG